MKNIIGLIEAVFSSMIRLSFLFARLFVDLIAYILAQRSQSKTSGTQANRNKKPKPVAKGMKWTNLDD
jgi:hypothetical protein